MAQSPFRPAPFVFLLDLRNIKSDKENPLTTFSTVPGSWRSAQKNAPEQRWRIRVRKGKHSSVAHRGPFRRRNIFGRHVERQHEAIRSFEFIGLVALFVCLQ